MAFFSVPLVDYENPLYCPEVTAHQYMSSIRLFQASVKDTSRFPYLHRLCNAFTDGNFQDSPVMLPPPFMGHFPPSKDRKEQDGGCNSLLSLNETSRNRKPMCNRLSSSASDAFLSNPPRTRRRSLSHVDMSFVLSAKAGRLRFSDKISRLPSSDVKIGRSNNNASSDELFWPDEPRKKISPTTYIGPGSGPSIEEARAGEGGSYSAESENPSSIAALLRRLEKLVPGMRLQDRLDASTTTHQDIVNLLGIKGHLNPQTLSLFRYTRVQSLRLTESMADVDGLNLLRIDTLKVLSDSTGFLSLQSIVLSDVPLVDDDMACLSNLRALQSLFLDDTQISDIAVMHLISLRQGLNHLELSWNDRITDDGILTLCKFTCLDFLSLKGTAVTMKGLRKLAWSAKERGKKISIMLPSDCEEYMCNLHVEYGTVLSPPLIHDPDACHTLSKEALRKNLGAHAARNPRISMDGTRVELEKRLEKILLRRKNDMIVQGFMLQGFVTNEDRSGWPSVSVG